MKRKINIIGAYVMIAIAIGLTTLDVRYGAVYLLTLMFSQLISESLKNPSAIKK